MRIITLVPNLEVWNEGFLCNEDYVPNLEVRNEGKF
jgi:hypothetical protein